MCPSGKLMLRTADAQGRFQPPLMAISKRGELQNDTDYDESGVRLPSIRGFERVKIPIGEYLLRSWSSDDAPAIAKYANNRKIWPNLRDAFPNPYDEDDAREWLAGIVGQNSETSFAVASADETIGGIAVHPGQDVRRRTGEIGYWMGEPYWGRGIATDAVRAVVDHASAEFDLMRVEAYVFEWNPASCRVLEKVGFVQEARFRRRATKDGKTIDEYLYALVRE